jgi:hypothetical protein
VLLQIEEIVFRDTLTQLLSTLEDYKSSLPAVRKRVEEECEKALAAEKRTIQELRKVAHGK